MLIEGRAQAGEAKARLPRVNDARGRLAAGRLTDRYTEGSGGDPRDEGLEDRVSPPETRRARVRTSRAPGEETRVEWVDVLRAMRDHEVDAALASAWRKFDAVMETPEPSADVVLGTLPEADRRPLLDLPDQPRDLELGGERRRGRGGRIDPEWAIAPLTRVERRQAEPLRRWILDSAARPANDCGLPQPAREALMTAVARYDDRRLRRLDRAAEIPANAVRLSVFIDGWDLAGVAQGVRGVT